MPLYIMYFNLKDGVSEEEFAEKSREWLRYAEEKLEYRGAAKLYRHHFFGANKRVYQMHFEFEGFGDWDEFAALLKNDAKAARILQEWHGLLDFNTHYDEFVREIPL